MDKQAYLLVLVIGQLLLLALDLGERYRTRHTRTRKLRPAALLFLMGTIIVYGAMQFGGLALVPNAEQVLLTSQAFIDDALGHRSSEGLDMWGVVLVGVASFYFAGLCDYLFHRFVSHSRPMWFSHENHHLTTDVSVYMPGLSVRPFAVIVVFPTMVITIFSVQLALGLSGRNGWDLMPVLYSIVIVQTSILGITHSAFLRRCWWLHDMLHPVGIATPQEHWLHHTADLECNYGNFITLWDRVFGTYVDPRSVNFSAHRAGLAYDQDFLGAITLGKLKLPEKMRRRFQLENFCYVEASDANT
ncbi:MAG: sterol desaturase family protein [Gammaproteobacteria bacterium]|nr:sterol desaturase family protein [Gammaproteobacteria bacterium]